MLLLLGILLMNAAARRFAPQRVLSQRELLFTYASLLSVAAISGQEFAIHFYLNLAGLVYYSSPQSNWFGLWNDLIPSWLVPATHFRDPAIVWVFEGTPEGARPPLTSWVRPLLYWTPYLFSVYATALFVSQFFARHWADKERLVYPIAQVPEDLTRDSPPRRMVLAQPLFWLGLAVAAVPYSLRALSLYYPAVPDPRLQRSLEEWFRLPEGSHFFSAGFLRAFNSLNAHVYPEMVGIAYLLSGEVGLSFWFFFLFRQLEVALRMALGWDFFHGEFLTYQSVGAYTVTAAMLFFLLLKTRALKKDGLNVSGTLGPLFPALLFAFLILLWGHQVAGVSIVWLAVWLGGLLITWIVVARVVAESGLFIYSSPFRVYQVLFDLLGRERLGAKNIVLVTAMSWVQARSTATLVSGYLVNAFRLSQRAGIPDTFFVFWLLLCFLLTLVTCHVTIPQVLYRYGVPKLSWWAKGAAVGTTNFIGGYLMTSRPVTLHHGASFVCGCLITYGLIQARLRWASFPFHPLGFVACQGWPMDRYWLSIFLGWLSQRIALRAAGHRLWNALRPLAYGLIVGGTAGLSFWILIRLRWPTAESVIMD